MLWLLTWTTARMFKIWMFPVSIMISAKFIYSRFSLSRSQRDSLKYFEISILRHIRFAELSKLPIEQPNFTNEPVICLHYSKIYVENIVEKGEKLQFLFISTIFYLLSWPTRRIRFSLRDKRLFEITEVEITRVDCSGWPIIRVGLSLLI